MQSLQEIIKQLKELSEKTIPQLSRDITQHSQNIFSKYQVIQNVSRLRTPVNDPNFAYRYVSVVQAMFDARYTISNALNVCTQVSQLAQSLEGFSETNHQSKSVINAQIVSCEQITEELYQFNETVNETMIEFSRICSNNESFKSNFKSYISKCQDLDFNAWCEFWMDIPKESDELFGSPLEAAIGLIMTQPLKPQTIQVGVS